MSLAYPYCGTDDHHPSIACNLNMAQPPGLVLPSRASFPPGPIPARPGARRAHRRARMPPMTCPGDRMEPSWSSVPMGTPSSSAWWRSKGQARITPPWCQEPVKSRKSIVCICVYVFDIYIYIYLSIYLSIYACMCTYLFIYIYMYIK